MSAARRIRRCCGFWGCSSKYWLTPSACFAVPSASPRQFRYDSGPRTPIDEPMQALFAIVPLAAFAAAYYLRGIYFATAVLMAAMVLLVLVDLVRTRRIPPMHLLSTILVLLLGSATLILRDVRFLKW